VVLIKDVVDQLRFVRNNLNSSIVAGYPVGVDVRFNLYSCGDGRSLLVRCTASTELNCVASYNRPGSTSIQINSSIFAGVKVTITDQYFVIKHGMSYQPTLEPVEMTVFDF